MEILMWIVIFMIMVILVFNRWFWIVSFGLAGIAAAFWTLACIFHFQILAAMGFALLALFMGGIASTISEH